MLCFIAAHKYLPYLLHSDNRCSNDTMIGTFLDPEGGCQKATLFVLVVIISSLKIPKAFLIRS